MKDQPQEHVINRIRSSIHDFSDKEKLIANYILDNPKKIIHFTINQIAEDLNIADATVFRFCKRLGFKGYQAMKIALAAEVVQPIRDIHETVNEEDTELEVANKVFHSNIRAIEETLKVIHNEKFQAAVHALLDADRIELYGNGGSGIIALDAHHKLLRTGIRTSAYTDTHMQLISASQLNEKDVAILISHSGSNTDILQVLDIIEETGAKTIGITNFAKSPLSQRVDIPLYTVSEETEYRSEALASRIAELTIIDALYVNISKGRKEAGSKSLQKIRKAISMKRI